MADSHHFENQKSLFILLNFLKCRMKNIKICNKTANIYTKNKTSSRMLMAADKKQQKS